MPKLKADPGPARVPRRNSVQEMAELYGYTRTLDADGQPMLTKKMPEGAPLNFNNKKKAKVIGPIRIAAVRG
jgi:hypothetical protein